jgi:hypothetical protein
MGSRQRVGFVSSAVAAQNTIQASHRAAITKSIVGANIIGEV